MIKNASPAWPLVAVFALWMVGCSPNGSGPAETGTPDTEAVDETADEVLTVVNSLFQAMQARDSTRIQMTLHPDAQFTSVNLTGDAPAIRRVEGSAFATSVGQPGPAYIERMFDPFYTTRAGGTGLGLALAAMISRNHDAKWSVSNQATGGAAFTLLLPLSRVLMTTANQLESMLDVDTSAKETKHAH